MQYVYILISLKDLNLYIGLTHDLKRRFEEHNSGLSVPTKNRLPLELLYYEAYKNKIDAIKREKFLKSGRGHELIYKQLEKTLEKFKILGGKVASPPNRRVLAKDKM